MFLYQNTPRARGRLFGQYGGAGVIATRKKKTRFQRKGVFKPTRKVQTYPISSTEEPSQAPRQAPRRATKRASKRAPRRTAKRTPKRAPKRKTTGLESVIQAGKKTLERGLKRGVRRVAKALPASAAQMASAAGEYVAPSVMKLGSKAIKAVRKRFNPDEDSLGPAQLPISTTTSRPKVLGRRRFKGQYPSAHQFVQGMRVKRGGGLFF